ncbi:methylenetetrahydrofolate--tRNA-(uracil-5-)-methyltransferase TrmFO [Dissulfurispira thermophila]|uniref:Methylenetetrahydrofolate--tRNA-(uracil-5-)-methyltransferase TrmFO n=2 Tax=root TaxID=1 RepID=A0A7G1H0Z2_9BACT|nr:methylenetetrahydrofolate--tRNA-(uracil(54)-C(5))-methyltransferase (FADH(2)-oxidizing) TrmFO [Dissulfurispira thermophila]BCB95771.1 methylenetetrahydrofolate--tRNA-(uracil-5-)-methyltransferase TrmFO [Dissulfurispira thermophila]
MKELIIIGGGLAGCEAAWQAARFGVKVVLFEMRPNRMTEVHKTPMLSELVCSNSLRSKEVITGPGLLKKELEVADSLIMKAANAAEVSAGSAFAVDRNIFSKFITQTIESHPNIRVIRKEIIDIPDTIAIIATGPLTSNAMANSIKSVIGDEHLYFYDAIAPIIDAESIDYSKVYLSSRYGKGGDDYVNCPMTRDEYNQFYDALIEADTVSAKDFEDLKVFEGCMPIEVMGKRGRNTLIFGPLKPVGLPDPLTGKTPYAVVQLRPENRQKTAYNMVGFQTRLKWPEQKRVFRMIPGLENAEFLRFGSIHRNTFINSPRHLNADLTLKEKNDIYIAGQITGVEGYIESTAMGLIAGINAAKRILGKEIVYPPRESAHGSLIAHITESDPENFQPSNINFGLLPAGEEVLKIRDKRVRRQRIAETAIKQWRKYIDKILAFII